MGRGSSLTEIEKGKILALKSQNMSSNNISLEINRSRHVVQNFLKKQENYGTAKSCGKPSSLTSRDKRRILRAASNQSTSINQIRANLNLSQSKSTIWRALHSSGEMQHMKMRRTPRLLEHHKTTRLNWARETMSWSTEWKKVIFSDEKKWNLDGPDGSRCYWHDLRKEPLVFSKRHFGGGSVMTWAAFGWNGKTEMVFVDGRMDSNKYQQLLQTNLLPAARAIGGRNWIFQQDNAPCHASSSTKEWFHEKNIRVLNWPALSPDLNPIENLWGILTRRVYRNGRQFQSLDDLRKSITEEWNLLSNAELQNLISSMPDRVYKVINGNGASINN